MINRDFAQSYQAYEFAKADGGEDGWTDHVTKYPLAVAGDLGQTVVNSAISTYNFFVPEAIEASHIDEYAFMNADIASYTKRHEDAVRVGSFIGSIAIPGLAVNKVFNLARSGAGVWGYAYRGVGLNSFNNKILALAPKAKELAKNGALTTTEYSQLLRSGKFWVGSEALAENVAFEASFAALANQHAYMEEGYSPWIAGLGVGIGTAVGGVMKWARVSGELRAAAASGRQESFAAAVTGMVTLQHGNLDLIANNYGLGTAMDGYKKQYSELTEALAAANADPESGIWVRDLFSSLAQTTKSRAQDTFNKLASPEMRAEVVKRSGSSQAVIEFWELEPLVEGMKPLGKLTVDQHQYMRPDKHRMTAHYLFGQDQQAVGITEAAGKLHADPIESSRLPWKKLADGEGYEVTDSKQLIDIARVLSEGRYTRTVDPITGEAATQVVGKFNFSQIDKQTKTFLDPKTGKWTIDLSKVRASNEDIAIYLALQWDKKASQVAKIIEPVKKDGSSRLQDMYGHAVALASIDVRSLPYRFDTIAQVYKAGEPDDLAGVMYHGSEVKGLSVLKKDAARPDGRRTSRLPGVWVTPDREMAARWQGDGQMYMVKPDLGNKVFDIAKEEKILMEYYRKKYGEDMPPYLLQHEVRAGSWSAVEIHGEEFYNFLRSKGYTSVKATEAGNPTYLIFDDIPVYTPKTPTPAIPSFVGQYQTIRYWDGEILPQTSLAAHMTKQYANVSNVGIHGLSIEHEAAELVKVKMGTGEFKSIYTMAADISATQRLSPTSYSDERMLSAILGMRRWVDTLGKGQGVNVGAIKLAPEDYTRIQAAIVNGVEIEGAGTELARLELLRDTKMAAVQKLLVAVPDIDDLAISIHTNTPIRMVQEIRSALDRTQRSGNVVTLRPQATAAAQRLAKVAENYDVNDFMVYRTVKDAEDYLKDPFVSLRGVNSQPIDAAATAARLDKEALDNIQRELVDQISATASAKSPLVRAMWEGHVQNGQVAAIAQGLAALFDDSAAGGVYSSLDFSLRRYKDLVKPLIAQGQVLQNTINEVGIKPAKELLRGSITRVVESKESTVQFEYVRNGLDGLAPADFDAARGLIITDDNKILLKPGAKDGSTPASYLKYPDGQEIVLRPEVATLLQDIKKVADDLWALDETTAKLAGRDISGKRRNLWIPYESAKDHRQAFVYDSRTNKITRIIGRDKAAFEQQVKDFELANAAEIAAGKVEIHSRTKGDLGKYLRLRNLSDIEHVNAPLPMMKKAGIAHTKITGNPAIFSEIMESIENSYNRAARSYIRTANSDILSKLDDIETFHRATDDANISTLMHRAQSKVSPATMAKAAMMGLSLQGEAPVVKMVDDMFSFAIDRSYQLLTDAHRHMQKKLQRGNYSPEVFKEYSDALAAAGIPVPWKDAIHFAAANTPELRPVAKSFVAASSNVAATLALRLFDTSHAIVTTLSTPILLAGELAGQEGMTALQSSKLLMETARDWSRATLNGGIAAPEWRKILEEGAQLGHTIRKTSEATEAMMKDFGSRNWWDRFQDTRAFYWFTRPSDFSEEMTREMAYMVGYKLSLAQSPASSKALHQAAAALFTNRTMGNYASRQRPVFFQGAAGQAIGLFQTFMYTLGQNAWRYTENRQLGAIGGMLGGYAGMFGMSALPMYDVVDRAIGAWTSAPDNTDITQTIYAAFGDKVAGHTRSTAEFMLYGIPSTLLQTSFWTRGEIQPRLPLTSGGLPWPPAAAMLADTLQVIGKTASKTVLGLQSANGVTEGFTNSARAIGEGIAMQHAFRPAARWAEIAMGKSIDNKSETVLSGEDVTGPWPVFARVLASRPLKEQVIRNQNFRARYYDMVDQGKRSKYTEASRMLVRADGDLSEMFAGYLADGGKPAGWRQIVNEIYLSEDGAGAEALLKSSAKHPGIAGIMEGYAF